MPRVDLSSRRVPRQVRRVEDGDARSSRGRATAKCTSASPAPTFARFREGDPKLVVIAHPECPPDVLAEADYVGSTQAWSSMSDAQHLSERARAADDRVFDGRQRRGHAIRTSSSCGPAICART